MNLIIFSGSYAPAYTNPHTTKEQKELELSFGMSGNRKSVKNFLLNP